MNAFEYGFFDELEKLATRIDPSFRERELAWKPKDRSRRDFGDMLTRESRRNYDARGFTPEAKAIRTVRQAARSAPTGRISERMPIPEPQISAPSPAAASSDTPVPQAGQRRRERLARGLRRVQRPQKSAPSATEKLQAASSQGSSPYLPVPVSSSSPSAVEKMQAASSRGSSPYLPVPVSSSSPSAVEKLRANSSQGSSSYLPARVSNSTPQAIEVDAKPIPQVGQRSRERLAQGVRRLRRPQRSAPPAAAPASTGRQSPQMPNSRWGGAPNPNPNPMPAQPAAPSMASASTVPPVVPQAAAPAAKPGMSNLTKGLLGGGAAVLGGLSLSNYLRRRKLEKARAEQEGG